MWSGERRKYDMRRGRIKNRDKIDPLNKNPSYNINHNRATSVIYNNTNNICPLKWGQKEGKS